MTIWTVSTSNNGLKVRGDSQAAWLRFQEVQGLHQLQADQPYQEDPAGWREAGVSWQVQGTSGSEIRFFCKAHLQWPLMSQDHLSTDSRLQVNKTHPLARVTDRPRRSRRAGGASRTLKEVGDKCLSIKDSISWSFYVSVRCRLTVVLQRNILNTTFKE